jgi:hypothetical protein
MVRIQRLTLWLCLILALPINAAPRDDRVGGIIVELQTSGDATGVSTAVVSNLSATAGHALRVVRKMSGNATLLGLQTPVDRATAEALAARISSRADVRYAVPNYRRWPSLVPNDTLHVDQWYLHAATVEPGAANLPQAWDITTGGTGTVVAVLDTGITVHEDLDIGRILPGYDFVQDEPLLNIDDNDVPDGRDNDPSDPGDAAAANECGSGFPSQRNRQQQPRHRRHQSQRVDPAGKGAGKMWRHRCRYRRRRTLGHGHERVRRAGQSQSRQDPQSEPWRLRPVHSGLPERIRRRGSTGCRRGSCSR